MTARNGLLAQQEREQHVGIELDDLGAFGGRAEVAAHRRVDGVAVRDDVVAHARERHVQTQRIDVGTEQARGLAAREDRTERGDDRRHHLVNARGLLHVARLVQVLVIHEPQEFGMIAVVIPDEMREPRDGLDRCEPGQVERALGFVQRAERVFEHRSEQLLLASEVVVEHALVGFRASRNLVDAGAKQAAAREFFRRGEQDAAARAFRISFDFRLIHGGRIAR
ncbi:hypothetical protein PT2222_90130 [Paraburkholderia tropica]